MWGTPKIEQNRTDLPTNSAIKCTFPIRTTQRWPKIGQSSRRFGPQLAEYEGTPPGQFVIQKSIPKCLLHGTQGCVHLKISALNRLSTMQAALGLVAGAMPAAAQTPACSPVRRAAPAPRLTSTGTFPTDGTTENYVPAAGQRGSTVRLPPSPPPAARSLHRVSGLRLRPAKSIYLNASNSNRNGGIANPDPTLSTITLTSARSTVNALLHSDLNDASAGRRPLSSLAILLVTLQRDNHTRQT